MHFINNTPCPCILWSLSGRDPAEFHVKRKAIEKAEKAEKAKVKKGKA